MADAAPCDVSVVMVRSSWKWRKRSSAKVIEGTREGHAILSWVLPGQAPLSKLCNELGSSPTVFYSEQREFLKNRSFAFEQQSRPNRSAG